MRLLFTSLVLSACAALTFANPARAAEALTKRVLPCTTCHGKEGRAAYLAYRYNDEFRVNAAGQVTLQDGTPLRVPVSASTPIAADGRTYAATVGIQDLNLEDIFLELHHAPANR